MKEAQTPLTQRQQDQIKAELGRIVPCSKKRASAVFQMIFFALAAGCSTAACVHGNSPQKAGYLLGAMSFVGLGCELRRSEKMKRIQDENKAVVQFLEPNVVNAYNANLEKGNKPYLNVRTPTLLGGTILLLGAGATSGYDPTLCAGATSAILVAAPFLAGECSRRYTWKNRELLDSYLVARGSAPIAQLVEQQKSR